MLPDDHADSRGKRRAWKAVFSTIILAIVAVAAFQLISQSSENRGLALRKLAKLPAGSSEVGQLVIANCREYRTNAVLWSFAYFGCLFGSAFASALAGVVLKLDILKDSTLKNDSAAALAAIAALLVTLSTSGDFQRKWQSNRIAADAMENLSYDLLRAGTSLNHGARGIDASVQVGMEEATRRNSILDRIKAINEARSEGVLGKSSGEVGAGNIRDKGGPKEPPMTSDNDSSHSQN